MKTGRYNLKELLTHNEIEQIIIPEIQRDYVWQSENVIKLLDSISQHYNKKKEEKFVIEIENKKLEAGNITEYLQREYEKLKFNIKIGFIYAYHDNEYAGKFFLIDGQQRFTTLYLLILALHKITEKQNDFRSIYFKDNQLKIDYKVREASHDFLTEFVKNQLLAEPIDIRQSSKYYENEYDNDETIRNLIRNYKIIESKLNDYHILNPIDFLTFVEEFIELNYFDTNLSEQGEQLYLYMNSRGENLSYHELIKSEIVKKEDNLNKKKEIGKYWEDWQNFFWIHRIDKENGNADPGFQEFLKWVSIIHICTCNNPEVVKKIINNKEQTIREAKENYINRNPERKKEQEELLTKYQINTSDINADYLQIIFASLNSLYGDILRSPYIPVENSWLGNSMRTIDYVIICPLLYYISNNIWADEQRKRTDVERLTMFLKNLSYFESTLGKSPDSATIDAIELVKALCDSNQKDITFFLDPLFNNKYKSILTESERYKLKLFANENKYRINLEQFIWDITLTKEPSEFLEGDINILFECLNNEIHFNSDEDYYSDQDITSLNEYRNVLEKVIIKNKTNDLLRRAMLTYGDYLVTDRGGRGYFEGYIDRFSFLFDDYEWRKVFSDPDSIKAKEVIISFITDIKSEFKENANIDVLKILDEKIKSYKENEWEEPFIKEPAVLEKCGNKKILFENDTRIILLSKIMTSAAFCELQTFLLHAKWDETWFCDDLKPGICVFDFDCSNNEIIPNKEQQNKYAIDIVWKSGKWYFTLLYRDPDESKVKLQSFADNGKWVWINDRVSNSNEFFYEDDPLKSILENVDEAKLMIDSILNEIETILRNN